MKTRSAKAQSAPSLADKSLAALRALTKQEMEQAYASAKSEGKAIEPTWLRTLWEHRLQGERPEGIERLIAILRRGLESPEMSDPEEAPKYLAKLIYFGVERFERLVAGGVLDEAVQGLNALPMLYSPTAGDGASKWVWAKGLFQAKSVGVHATTRHNRSVAGGGRTIHWRNLAEDAVTTAIYAAVELPQLDAHRKRAVGGCRFDFRGLRARYGVFGTFYLLDDGCVLIWPEWLDRCRGLPKELKANVSGFKAACLAIAQEFFGDPHNAEVDRFLKPLLKTARENGQSAGHARMEAAKMVVAAVGRLAA